MANMQDDLEGKPEQEDKTMAGEEFTFDMSMKKKKKKKKTETEEQQQQSQQPQQPEQETTIEPSTVSIEADGSIVDPSGGVTFCAEEPWTSSERDYTYQELLGRVFSILRQNNPDLAGDRRKFTIVPPIIGREGSKKTAFTNIADLCRRMRRPIEHLTQFLLTELGTTGSMDGSQRLIIKGRFQQLQMETVIRRYITEYVTCKTCRSSETQLSRENRLFFLKCESCGSTRSVTTIKAGFKAQTGRRVRAA